MTARRVSRVVRRTLEVQRLKALMYSSSEVTRGGDRCRVLLLDQVYLLILVQTLEGSVCRVVMHGNPLYVGIVNHNHLRGLNDNAVAAAPKIHAVALAEASYRQVHLFVHEHRSGQ